ncbi:MAG: NADH-quinone oxidoreductase subunit N [Chloroflexi bacterium]|nr:NADH-quinone oxidoreductase subunit N [Chloroflexota bacterium]
MTALDFQAVLPLTVLTAWTVLLVLVDLFIPAGRKSWTALLAALGMLVSLALSAAQMGQETVAFNGMVVVDGFSVFLSVLFLGSGLVGIALSFDYLRRMGLDRSEYYILLSFSISGMMLMAVAADLIVVFLALELLSIPLYVLAGFARPRLDSEEAALKYFLLGAFAGGFVVYGVALVFGATGATAFSGILAAINGGQANVGLLSVGAALVLIGLGFKVAAVPFHMWTPDVYQGAPTAVTAFMAVGAKAAGFAALLRVFVSAFPALSETLLPVFWGMAALTMILGNLAAIAQSNIKRMLAYSSIAHAGYILMAAVSFGNRDVAPDAVGSALFYLFAYALTSFGAWAVVMSLEKAEHQGLALEDYAGLGRKYPALAAAMVIFMLSFAGVPPTLGFVGKFYLFRTALQGGQVALAVIGVLTSLISAYYYLRVIVMMYMRTGEPQAHSERWLNLTVGATALATVALSLFAAPLFTWASQAVLRMF